LPRITLIFASANQCVMKTNFHKLLFLYCFFIHFLFGSLSQNENQAFLAQKRIDTLDNGNFKFGIENINFLKNNEYTNSFVAGYTLIGYKINSYVSLQRSSKTRIAAGVSLLKFSGIDNYSQLLPFFRIQHKLGNSIDIVFGNIFGTLNHQIIEPLFDYEKHFSAKNEQGLQFLFNFETIKSDVWIDWQQFIFQNSPIQERFVVGNSNFIALLKNYNNLNISLPIQFLVFHRGGQIDTIAANVQSLANATIGLRLDYSINNTTVSFENYAMFFSDISPNPELIYKKGAGFYSALKFQHKNIITKTAYFATRNFINFCGDPFYSPLSVRDSVFTQKLRKILTLNCKYQNISYKDVNFCAETQLFYDFINSKLDYYFACYLIFNYQTTIGYPHKVGQK